MLQIRMKKTESFVCFEMLEECRNPTLAKCGDEA
jgi:hypothetical protein